MKILIAPDKFKGSLNAAEVCDAITKGIKINKIKFRYETFVKLIKLRVTIFLHLLLNAKA